MSFPDSPDYTRGVVAAQILLATNSPATGIATIDLPSDVTALWIYNAQFADNPPPAVIGTATGTYYTVYSTLLGATGSGSVGPWVAIVSPVLDSQVTVNAPGPGALDWYVVGDTSMRVVASLPWTTYPPV